MKKLRSVREWNSVRQSEHDALVALNNPHPNGVMCPNCAAELWDSNPMFLLTSNPAQKNVHCPNCKYKGYLLA
jgi:hypothetical protein